MKVTYSWLKEFVDIKLPPEALADRLTMAGLTVASCAAVDHDWVFDIEVTSNRPDWLSVRGIVREVCAMTGQSLKKGLSLCKTFPVKPGVSVSIADKKDCSLYFGRLITGVKVSASPQAMQKRLNDLDIRSVNNVVDITNYCLLEYGQPLHAFDWARVEGSEIRVRRARAAETLRLIDGSEKKCTPAILVIADAHKPLAAAGIMGGKDSEVTAQTTSILLESACFDPVVVRRGTRELGVASDSSYRFERGVDAQGVRRAMDAATAMILELCGGKIESTGKAGTDAGKTAPKISYDIQEASGILDIPVTSKDASQILKHLGFGVRQHGRKIQVTVPSFRRDVKIKEDVTEEIARIYGYDKIPLTQACIKPFDMKPPAEWAVESRAGEFFKAAGLKEIITYSLLSRRDYEQTHIGLPEDALCLKNPLSQDFSILRTTLVPNLLQTASYNAKRGQADLELFEVGHMFVSRAEYPAAGLLLCGDRQSSWVRESVPYDFYDLKGICERFLDDIGIKDRTFEASEQSFAAAGMCADIRLGNKTAGFICRIKDSVKKAWDIKSKKEIFIAQLDLSVLAQQASFVKKPHIIASTPSISRDVSVLVSGTVSFEKICGVIRQKTRGYLRDIRLAERYKGKDMGAFEAALTISLDYGRDDLTLTDEEIAPVHSAVLEALTRDLLLTLR